MTKQSAAKRVIEWTSTPRDLWRVFWSRALSHWWRYGWMILLIAVSAGIGAQSWAVSLVALVAVSLAMVIIVAVVVPLLWRRRTGASPHRSFRWDDDSFTYVRGTDAAVTRAWHSVREVRRKGGMLLLARQYGGVTRDDIWIPRRAISPDQERDLRLTCDRG